jgi:hypothetical protein
MTTETFNTDEILSATATAISELSDLMLNVDDDKVNTIPFEGSWTAPQLLRHVIKSINGMTKVMQTDAKTADRNPAERIEQLKSIFLDFSRKLTQPDFIIPEEQVYEKLSSVDEIKQAFFRFKTSADRARLNDLVEGLPLGPITKLEIIHFVLYHTQRHLQQMKNICDALKKS